MVEWFKKSDLCIKFLENYPYELLSEIIPNVFEIGILTLKNSFNKFYFKWEEIRDILYDLRKNNYYDNLNFKSMRKIIDFKDFFENEEYNEEKERLIFSGKKYSQKHKKFILIGGGIKIIKIPIKIIIQKNIKVNNLYHIIKSLMKLNIKKKIK